MAQTGKASQHFLILEFLLLCTLHHVTFLVGENTLKSQQHYSDISSMFVTKISSIVYPLWQT